MKSLLIVVMGLFISGASVASSTAPQELEVSGIVLYCDQDFDSGYRFFLADAQAKAEIECGSAAVRVAVQPLSSNGYCALRFKAQFVCQ